MPSARIIRILAAIALAACCAPVLAQEATTTVALSFEFFRQHVQPVLLAKRPGNIACATCHAGAASSQFRLQPLDEAARFFRMLSVPSN